VPRPVLFAILVLLVTVGGCGENRPADPLGPGTVVRHQDRDPGDPPPRRLPELRLGGVAPDPPPVPEGPSVPGQAVITLLPGDDDIDTFNDTWGTSTIRTVEGTNSVLVAMPDGYEALDLAGEMIAEGDCEWAEPNYLSETPEGQQGTIPFYEGDAVYDDVTDQDALKRIGIPAAHMVATGAGVTVAVLDTGIDTSHPAFAGAVSPLGWDFVDDDASPLDERNGLDDDEDGEIDEGAGHGTHVAGLIRATAPGSTLLPVRVLDSEGLGTAVGLARGIRWAIANGADVINLSLGMYVDSHVVKRAVDDAAAQGIIVVNSAGNRGIEDNDHFPARMSKVLSVAASDPGDTRAPFSNYGSHVAVAAPGVGLLSTFLDQGFAVWSGTSMAAPLVSGSIALRLEVASWTTESDLRDAFDSTCVPLVGEEGSAWEGKMGSGRILTSALVTY